MRELNALLENDRASDADFERLGDHYTMPLRENGRHEDRRRLS